jgi:hypothetical protein
MTLAGRRVRPLRVSGVPGAWVWVTDDRPTGGGVITRVWSSTYEFLGHLTTPDGVRNA